MKIVTAIAVILLGASSTMAQQPGRGGGPQAPQVTSPDVGADRRVSFRIYAPQAREIRLTASDIPGLGQNSRLTKADNGVWELTIGPIDSGAYRYNFNVDGVATIDPRNPSISESNNNVWSLVYVPGSELFDSKNVAHGAIAEITYKSSTLGRDRRMHVYTPPGYERNRDTYPVFYLLHGAFDGDDSWSTVGRAGFIVDNLIAANQAVPMIIVMPDGHTSRFGGGGAGGLNMADFVKEFNADIKPYVEASYRVRTDRASTAIAGLSMGGAQTLDIAMGDLASYAYVGVYSSGVFGIADGTQWEDAHRAQLDAVAQKRGLELFWFSTGKDDFLIETTKATVAMLEKHGFDVTYEESLGGHTWINWREYLNKFAPQLFR
jgi:enterochelin esterase family protein